MKLKELKQLIEETISSEVKKSILESTEEVYVIKNKKGEPVEMCSTKEEADQKLASYQKGTKDQEFIIEKGPKMSFEELDTMGEKLENMKQEKPVDEKLVGNQHKLDVDGDGEIEASDLAALRKGEKTEDECLECGQMNEDEPKNDDDVLDKLFGVTGDEEDTEEEFDESFFQEEEECKECGQMEEDTCPKCGKQVCECGDGMMKEGKKVLRMTESELVKFISTLVEETAPGLRKTMDVRKKSGEVNAQGVKDSMKNVESTHLKAEGSDNPEFPHQMNAKKEKVARVNDKEEDKIVAANRGGGLEDLDYSVKPSKKFEERVKEALEGSTKMGNSQDAANVVKSDLGKKIAEKVKDKKEKEEKETVVSWGHRAKEPLQVSVVKEADESKKMATILENEIKRMKEMTQYNKKTQ